MYQEGGRKMVDEITLSAGRARPDWPEGRPDPTLTGQGVRPCLCQFGPTRQGQGPGDLKLDPVGSTQGRPDPALRCCKKKVRQRAVL